MTATISREVWRRGQARRSRLGMPIMGTRRAWAMAFAAAMPTRSPVNKPGPMSTATTEISSSSMRAWRRTKSMAGARFAAWGGGGADVRGGGGEGQGQEGGAGDADHGHPKGGGHGLRGRDADPQPGEQAGADVDGHHGDLVELDAGLAADEVDGGRQVLGVALSARRVRGRQHTLVPTDGATDLLGRRGAPQEIGRAHV